jgi:cobalt/nickel transport protein
MAQGEKEHQLADSPFADYGVAGIDNPYLATAIVGVVGVLGTFAVGAGLFWLVRRRTPAAQKDSGGAGGSVEPGASVGAGTGAT